MPGRRIDRRGEGDSTAAVPAAGAGPQAPGLTLPPPMLLLRMLTGGAGAAATKGRGTDGGV